MTYRQILRQIANAVALWPCSFCGGGGLNTTTGQKCGVCKGKGTVSTPGAQ